jgi:hypothetical protein
MTSLWWFNHWNKKDNTGNQENNTANACQQILVNDTRCNEKKSTYDEKDPTRQLTLEFPICFVSLRFSH